MKRLTGLFFLILLITAGCGGRGTREAAGMFRRGEKFYAAGDFNRALPLLIRAHEKDPSNPVVCFYLGNIHSHHRLPTDALRYYHLGLKHTKNPGRFFFNIGLTQIQLGKYRAALHSLTRAVTVDPALADAHLDMGLAYYRLKDLKKAAAQWRLYLQKVPDAPQKRALLRAIAILEKKAGNG